MSFSKSKPSRVALALCLNSRALSKEDMNEGIEFGTMMRLAGWVKESPKVLSF